MASQDFDPKHLTDVATVKQMIANKDIQLFDVRNPDELKGGVIGGSTNIPFPEIEAAFALSEDEFQRKYNVKKPGLDDSNIIIHCGLGGRSAKSLRILLDKGYKNARHMVGGYKAWKEA